MHEAKDNRRFIAKKIASFFHAGDVINLGVGLPTLVGDYLPETVMVQAENGLLGSGRTLGSFDPEAAYFDAGATTVTLKSGASVFDICTSFGMIRQGLVDATVLGCFEVSQYGDVANWARPGSCPGMGGAMDLVAGVQQVIVATEHCTRDGAPKIVQACTLPLTGRQAVRRIVTELAVFSVSPKDGLTLLQRRDGVTIEELKHKTGAAFAVSDSLTLM